MVFCWATCRIIKAPQRFPKESHEDFSMMDSENPYSPPEMDAKPIVSKPAAPLSIQAILFSFEGRIPRRVYWAASICVGFVFYGVIFGLEAAFGPESSLSLIGIS